MNNGINSVSSVSFQGCFKLPRKISAATKLSLSNALKETEHVIVYGKKSQYLFVNNPADKNTTDALKNLNLSALYTNEISYGTITKPSDKTPLRNMLSKVKIVKKIL